MKPILSGVASCILTALATLTVASEDTIKTFPHVFADRSENHVVVEGQSTAVSDQEPIEFVLINSKSGHDYEALAITRATAADIRAGLEFVGLNPGRPVSHDNMKFWPRGDRLEIFFEWTVEDHDGSEKTGDSVPIGEMLRDVRAESGKYSRRAFIFTGSLWLPSEPDEESTLLSDAHEPHSIISIYNEPNSIIDVGRQTSQGDEYGHIMINPDRAMPAKHPVRIYIKPASGARALSEQDLVLKVEADAESETSVKFSLKYRDGDVIDTDGTLNAAINKFHALGENSIVPHVKVVFDLEITIERITSVCVLLSQIDSEKGIRVEPPLSGELYYRAFLPDPVIYDRENRGLQPAELHIQRGDDEINLKVVKAHRIWEDDQSDDDRLELDEYSVIGVSEAQDKLRELRGRIPVLLVHVDRDIVLGEVMEYVRPVLPDFPTVFILMEGGGR